MVCLLKLFCIFFPFLALQAHEGHHTAQNSAHEQPFLETEEEDAEAALQSGGLAAWIRGIGELHLIFLHFPIALIIMTAAAEILSKWYANPLFDHAARFMLISSAILSIPTVLCGFALGYGQVYEGTLADLYAWHRFFGVTTLILAFWATSLRERAVRLSQNLFSYYTCLFFLFLSVNITGLFGGGLAFGW
ncbi:DUF2231 domain-containing protein [Candidatus Protochlamydia phocaeensis]|uniref:DUF2231 domain-containing protein n=1 Tax=Candidatus Protochlamydia phocaeensis TaxID=1414722 RepID=UPI0008394690|nr:DUF2231 domain-containing protein [Candidatus Protochlamydia phocaeensis]